MHKISYTHTAYLTDEIISDILSTAFEGGITYWTQTPVKVDEWPEGAKHASDVVAKHVPVYIRNEDDEKWEKLTLPNLLNSIRWYLTTYNKSSEFFISGEFDAGDADLIVQHALFGDIVYG
jgi:hypothetical protein